MTAEIPRVANRSIPEHGARRGVPGTRLARGGSTASYAAKVASSGDRAKEARVGGSRRPHRSVRPPPTNSRLEWHERRSGSSRQRDAALRRQPVLVDRARARRRPLQPRRAAAGAHDRRRLRRSLPATDDVRVADLRRRRDNERREPRSRKVDHLLVPRLRSRQRCEVDCPAARPPKS